MTTAQSYHTATLLPNGKVLILGGSTSSGCTDEAELYDPGTGAFTATGSMTVQRCGPLAAVLPNGQVLIAGGGGGGGQLPSESTAELYDPTTGTFTATGSMITAHQGGTATLLGNGNVLIAGGDYGQYCATAISNAELYNPTTGTFSPTDSMTTTRAGPTATLLGSGEVLIAGGSTSPVCPTPLSSAELYDPTTGIFTATGSMNSVRFNHTATLLNNGEVLLAGGDVGGLLPPSSRYFSSAELYDPASGTFTATGSMTTPRTSQSATLLGNGQVLVAGGQNAGYPALSSAELYDPIAGTFSATASMNTARVAATATLLNNGQALVAGGYNNNGLLASAELYGPVSPPTLTITASGGSFTYGGTPPTITPSYSGFVNGDTASSLTNEPTCTTTATSNSPVGTYPTTCSGAVDSNYTITYQPGSLTITPAPLTITANNATKVLDAPNPAFTASYSGFVNGDTAASLTGTLNCATTATATSPVGGYPISCSGQSSNNYNITYVPGTLKILYASGGICDGDVGHEILQPINADGTSVWKQGRTIPVKFRVCDANGVSVGTVGVISSFVLTQIISGTVTTVDETISATTADAGFRFDSTAQQWIFNLSTSSESAGFTYVYSINLNDGTSIVFQYGLR